MIGINLIDTVVGDRYQLEALLGEGSFGTTYRAIDTHTQELVAIKIVDLRTIKEWKTLELIEREISILRNLDHPAIPTYIDSFEMTEGSHKTVYLLQQIAPGCSLSQWIEQGWKPTQSDIASVAEQMLHILAYLQSLTPPVIHRDIKPQNIIRDGQGNIYLVDFGAIQDTYRHTVTGGSTVVGTFGYMAPEQFRGQATLATDLYGLGATLIFLLTGKCPSDLPEKKFKIDYRSGIRGNIKQERFFYQWLDSLIEPAVEKRLSTASDALLALRRERPLPKHEKVGSDRFRIEKSTDNQSVHFLLIDVPAQGLQKRWFRWLVLLSAAVTLITGFGWYWLSSSSTGLFFAREMSLLILTHFLSWAVNIICFDFAVRKTRLIFTQNCFFLWHGYRIAPFDIEHESVYLMQKSHPPLVTRQIDQLQHLYLQNTFAFDFKGKSIAVGLGRYAIAIKAKRHSTYYFGAGLKQQELHQIIEEIQAFLH